MNTDITQEQEARATKIYDLAWELGLLMREHADDRWSGWKKHETTSTLVALMLETTRRTIRAGFADKDQLTE